MDKQPAEASQPPTPDPEQSLLMERTSSVVSQVVSMTVPPTGATHPEDFQWKDNKESWEHWTRRQVPKPFVKVLIALIIVTVVSFCPAMLRLTYYNGTVLPSRPTPVPDGSGVRSSDATDSSD